MHIGPRASTPEVEGAAPRVLTITFKLYVAKGLRANIRIKRVTDAVEQFENLIVLSCARFFPWASKISFSHHYGYEWFSSDTNEKFGLPPTPENNPPRIRS